MKAWDKLQPDDDLIAVMGKALQAQVRSESWRAGVDTPKAAREAESPEEEGRRYGWH